MALFRPELRRSIASSPLGIAGTGTATSSDVVVDLSTTNFSRFVRPGCLRVATTGTVPSGLLLSAYKNPTDGTTVVVAADTNASATSLPMFIGGAATCTFTPWVTSASERLVQKTAIAVSNSRVTYSFPAQSVITFVGKP